MQNDRSTLMAFMRSIRMHEQLASPAIALTTPVKQVASQIDPQISYSQNDRTTLRAAMDRMAASRDA